MTILVIAEHDSASLKAATLNTIAAARKIGGDIRVLVAGHNAQGAADAAAKVAGVSNDRNIRWRGRHGWGRLRIRKKSYAKPLAGGVAAIFGDKWRENSSAI